MHYAIELVARSNILTSEMRLTDYGAGEVANRFDVSVGFRTAAQNQGIGIDSLVD